MMSSKAFPVVGLTAPLDSAYAIIARSAWKRLQPAVSYIRPPMWLGPPMLLVFLACFGLLELFGDVLLFLHCFLLCLLVGRVAVIPRLPPSIRASSPVWFYVAGCRLILGIGLLLLYLLPFKLVDNFDDFFRDPAREDNERQQAECVSVTHPLSLLHISKASHP